MGRQCYVALFCLFIIVMKRMQTSQCLFLVHFQSLYISNQCQYMVISLKMLWDSFSSVLNERYCNKNKCGDSDRFSCFIYGLVTDSFAQYLWRRICQVVFLEHVSISYSQQAECKQKKPLFSFRLKLINPMTRAKVSNQGGIVN